jgi:hypothetical protein
MRNALRHYVAGLLAALLILQPVLGHSQPTSAPAKAKYERYRLPVGTRLKTPQGTFQGYTLEEMKVLLKMDVDLWAHQQLAPAMNQLLLDNTNLSINLQNQLKTKDVIIQVLEDERVRLTEKWTKENKLRHIAENKVSWTTWFAWGAAGVATLAATVLAVVLAVKE